MAQIRPFKAYRPCKGMEERIAALPYDVYNRAEACEVVKKNPESFLAIDRAETQFGEEVDTYADCVYEKADQMLREKILEGKFVQDPTPCFYLYELTMDGHSQTGVNSNACFGNRMHMLFYHGAMIFVILIRLQRPRGVTREGNANQHIILPQLDDFLDNFGNLK